MAVKNEKLSDEQYKHFCSFKKSNPKKSSLLSSNKELVSVLYNLDKLNNLPTGSCIDDLSKLIDVGFNKVDILLSYLKRNSINSEKPLLPRDILLYVLTEKYDNVKLDEFVDFSLHKKELPLLYHIIDIRGVDRSKFKKNELDKYFQYLDDKFK